MRGSPRFASREWLDLATILDGVAWYDAGGDYYGASDAYGAMYHQIRL